MKCQHYLEETCTDKSNILSCSELIELHTVPCKKCGCHEDAAGQYRMFGAQTTTNITLQILMVLPIIQAVCLTESMIICLKYRGW
jgi:hypothetical protein